MSKKFKSKLCVYCAEEPSTSADHVFAREFLLPRHRMNLPKVPACDGCNREKANLEHYLASLLPFGGRHSNARENLETMVPKRLRKNVRLHRALAQGQGTAWGQADTLVVPTMTLPIDSGRFERLFQLIAKGLIWYHWQTYLTAGHFVEVWALTGAGARLFGERLFNLNARARVSANLGKWDLSVPRCPGCGLRANHCVDCAQITVWHIWVYEGLHVSDYTGGAAAISSRISVVTGPQSAKRHARLALRFGWTQGGLRLVR